MVKKKTKARKRIRKSKKKVVEQRKRFLIFSLAGVLLAFIGLGAGLVVYASIIKSQLPPLDQFGERKISQSTKIYDRTGGVLLYEIFGDEKRTIVSFDSIPERLKQATLAAENENFYSQPAFDWKAIIRALMANIREGEIVQGGSTITQQLVKNTLLSPEQTITRKVKEIILAVELESKYSKEEIFSAYLNQIPYGSNAYGVEAASQTFFNRPVDDLTLSELAILASLPQAPTYYSPWGDNVSGLINRRNRVLDRMADLGYITEEERDQAKLEDVTQEFAAPSIGSIRAPHFSLAVRSYLIDKYGEEVALSGGLRVITTLDWEMQEIAEEVVSEGAARNESLYGGKDASLVAQDPRTGQILTMVGSRDWYDSEAGGQFNVITQGLRQPGSALKPFVYLEAFNKGFHPKSIVMDVPTEFVSGDPVCPAIITPTSKNNPRCFNPENFDGIFRGPVSLEKSLSQSINVPSVKALHLANFDDVLKTIDDFGITTLDEKWRYGLSLVLGGGEIRPIELINAYSTLADNGIFHEQSLILEIRDSRGTILEEYSDESRRVYPPEPVRNINQILSSIELRSGLFESSLPLTIFSGKEIALKTGTTNNYKDAWAFGYSPSIAVGVWAGNNDNTVMHAQGSSILAAIPMWSNFLNRVFEVKDFDRNTFEKPTPQNPPNKPMLNGQSLFYPENNREGSPQIHSILYWVDRSDVLGPPPINPSRDSQFLNWERAVENWANINMSNFSRFNGSSSENSNSTERQQEGVETILMLNVRPRNGDSVGNNLVIEAQIESLEELSNLELTLNNNLIQRIDLSGNSYSLSYHVSDSLLPQNSIEIKVSDVRGGTKTESMTVHLED